MKALGLLKKAKKKLTKKRWIQGFSALSKTGEMVSTGSKTAVKFCAIGALSSVADVTTLGLTPYLTAATLLDDAVRGKFKGKMVDFNDAKGRKYEQVIGVYDRAIAAAVRKGL